jgi:hypothetical protein
LIERKQFRLRRKKEAAPGCNPTPENQTKA